MADDFDEEQPKSSIQNQPYDELLEVPDAEDVASVYTPTPRHPKINPTQQKPQPNLQVRPTPPPTSSSVSSKEPLRAAAREPSLSKEVIKEDENYQSNQRRPRNINNNMDDLSPSETPQEIEKINRAAQMADSGSEGNESGEESPDNYNEIPSGYDPAAFRDLPVPSEIKEIFKFIERYQPQPIELDFKLKPFIPDYIPSIGDIDAFIKVPRPDSKPDNLGLTVVDEPSSNQSDPHVLDLFFRTLSKQNTDIKQPSTVKMVEANNTAKAIESWIRNISALQKNKPVQSVNYPRAMPTIDSLMQVWPQEFEDLLKEVSLPSQELNVDLNTYVDIICALLDIPVYKSRIQSLHVLFSLYSEFKNSEQFKSITQNMNAFKGGEFEGGRKRPGDADHLIID